MPRSRHPHDAPLSVDCVLPLPVIDWEDVLLAQDPTRPPTRAHLRTLQKRNAVSQGLQVTQRKNGRLAGRKTYFSTLWGFSARLRGVGANDIAARLDSAAEDVERRFRAPLILFLKDNALSDLPNASFFPDLALFSAQKLHQSGALESLSVVSGMVVTAENSRVRVHGMWQTHEPVDITLPGQLRRSGPPRVRDSVWVISRPVLGAAVTELLDASIVAVNPQAASAYDWSRPGPEVAPVLTEEDFDDEAAARYQRIAHPELNDSYFDELLRDLADGRIPHTTIHLTA